MRDCDVFPVFRKRAEVAVAASGDQEDVVSVSEVGFDVPFSLHVLLQENCLSITARKTESLISPLATNPMPELCSTWKTPSRFAQCAGHELVS